MGGFFIVPKTLDQQHSLLCGVGGMFDRVASPQPTRALKQQNPLAPGQREGSLSDAKMATSACLRVALLGRAKSKAEYHAHSFIC